MKSIFAMSSVSGLDAPAERPTFRDAVFHPVRPEALPAEEFDGVERHDAVGTATLRHDVSMLWQLANALLQLRERHRQRPRQVTGEVFLARPDIDHRDFTGTNAAEQLVSVDGLHDAPFLQVLPADLVDLCEPRLRQHPQTEEEFPDLWVGQPVRHVQTCFRAVDQAGAPPDLKMMRGIRDALAELGRQGL